MKIEQMDRSTKLALGKGVFSVMTDEQLTNILEHAMRSLLRAQVDELLLVAKEEIKRRMR